MFRTTSAVAALTLITVSQSFAGVEIVLVDGLHLTGVSIERRGDEFLLKTEAGVQVAIPWELIREIQLSGERQILGKHRGGETHGVEARARSVERESSAAKDRPPRVTEKEQDSTGGEQSLRRDAPATPPNSLTPTPAEQLAAFGRDPATFQRGPITPTWHYDDVLGYESDVTQFRPSRWHRPPVDPTWRYDDELGYGSDVTQFNPTRWHRPPIPTWWYPTDGWGRGAGD